MTIFGKDTTPDVAMQRLQDDPNARIVECLVTGRCTTIHFTLAKQPLFAIFEGDMLLGVWDLWKHDSHAVQVMMEERGW